jgi:RNA polymerase sigma-70 factor (ECF subfamily)
MSLSTPFDSELIVMLPRLRRFAHALSQNGTEADDLAQATIERALRSRSQWQPGTRLDSWLFRIMRNLWIDTGRSRSRREKVEVPAEEAELIGDDPRESIEASLELKRAMAAMQHLPAEQLEVVSLILIEGFGYRETAEMLDLPIGTVSSRLVRGRVALLELMGIQNGNE